MSDLNEFDPFAEAIEKLNSQIAKLQAAIDALESVRPLLSGGATNSSSRGSAEANFGHDAFFGMTGADAAKKYLAATKKTAPPKAIAEALVAGGWKTSSKNIPENLRTILHRSHQFVVINGEFGLAEWYPGRKAGKKVVSLNPKTFSESSPDEEPPGEDEQYEAGVDAAIEAQRPY